MDLHALVEAGYKALDSKESRDGAEKLECVIAHKDEATAADLYRATVYHEVLAGPWPRDIWDSLMWDVLYKDILSDDDRWVQRCAKQQVKMRIASMKQDIRKTILGWLFLA